MDRQDDARRDEELAFSGDASYLEDLYSRYEQNPESVNGDWASFFSQLHDDKAVVEQNARGATWKSPNWPITANVELISALDGNWGSVEKAVGDKIKARMKPEGAVSEAELLRATRDSVRAIMLIRA